MSDWVKWASDTASYAKQAASQASVLVAGTELDKKLAEATTNEPWGASSTLLSEIAKATFGYDDFKTVMTQIWKNLQLTGSLWRVVYKTLNMLDYILRHGSERVIEDTRDHLRDLKALQKFEYIDPEGKDSGINVRLPPYPPASRPPVAAGSMSGNGPPPPPFTSVRTTSRARGERVASAQ